MVSDVKIIGIRGACPFDEIVRHFTSMGGDVVLIDPLYVYGKDHVISAVQHAERSFTHKTNRSKTLLTEILMYASGERQISKALTRMRPKKGCEEFVAVVIDIPDLKLDEISMTRCDEIIDGTPEKAKAMGLDSNGLNIPLEELALELVAMLDIAK